MRKKASDERGRDLQHEGHQTAELPWHLLSQARPGAQALKLPAVRGDCAALVGHPERWWAAFRVRYSGCGGPKESSDHVTCPLQGVTAERTSFKSFQMHINQTVVKGFYWPLL